MDNLRPLSDTEIEAWGDHAAANIERYGNYSLGYSTLDVARLIATIRERDARIASLESQVQTLEHWINSQKINTEARRAEAFALYCKGLTPEEAIKAAAAFAEEWEKRDE